MSSKQKLVVIGNGMVGHNFLEHLVESGGTDLFDIVTFCEEPRTAYDRVHLSEYFTGSTAEDLSMVTPGFFADSGIELFLNEAVTEIDRKNKTVRSANFTIAYDKLIFATGSYPFVPSVPGKDREECLVYRTIEDLENITKGAKTSKIGVVVGGGLLGLECANALKNLGLETHVVEFAPRPMAAQIDVGGGKMLRKKIEDLGVTIHTSKNTTEITDGENCKLRMIFADGEQLETDMIVFSAGIRPRDDLARACGLEMGQRGGITINNQCQTSDPDIYAIGECALWNNSIFGLVAPGYQMAKTAYAHIINEDKVFTGADMSTKLKLMGVDVGSIGDAQMRTPGALSYTYENEPQQVYKRIITDANGQQLLGAVLVGDTEEYDTLLQYTLNALDLPHKPETLILPQSDGERIGLGPDALPLTAPICSCHDVTKGQICDAIDVGHTDLPSVKAQTKASTGCGGCAALLKSVLDCELGKRGIEINTDICEHFRYTRQDLYNLVSIGEIKTFNELITKHGTGKGCDICKPAVSSILASYWNEYVLKSEHYGLQDTNDRYLGNMQKDGTYSIVPRIAGGEITPEKLIVLGKIAKDYELYTKITGGQRIDLFGARLEQLPEIWERLITAGFETGHAYGKSLRTVKSCVGNTWCRYGLDDSVGLAIELENRYKGLRSPHKIKFGVSGCTRECAEAQGKDIGIIATENGWNLYVCGNGGMRPRHADLFAVDLDKETLIRYIDRVLIFYVRTADKLQRTSVWMENLNGGLDYLKSVVIDDHLGINGELEKQMAHVVDTYECEWKKTVEDDNARKRFHHFVNSDKTDNNVVFVQERGQIRPATADERDAIPVSVA